MGGFRPSKLAKAPARKTLASEKPGKAAGRPLQQPTWRPGGPERPLGGSERPISQDQFGGGCGPPKVWGTLF